MLQPLAPRDRQRIELLALQLADTAYQRKSTPAGQARKSAFRAFALSLPPMAVKWASCVEDPRKAFIVSSWKPHTYDADRSLCTVVRPMVDHLIGWQWSHLVFVPDETSCDIASPLWGAFRCEIRVLNFRCPDRYAATVLEFWKEQEQRMEEALKVLDASLLPSSSLQSMPPSIHELGYLGLVGGWVVGEDGATRPDTVADESERRLGRKWVAVFGWQSYDGERKAWGEGVPGEGQECLVKVSAIADGLEQRWHIDRFGTPRIGGQKYEFPSSDEDEF